MKKLEITEKYKAYTEEEAKDFLDEVKAGANAGGYYVKKSGYEYKTKKSKGEIIAEGWLCTVTKAYEEFWGDED